MLISPESAALRLDSEVSGSLAGRCCSLSTNTQDCAPKGPKLVRIDHGMLKCRPEHLCVMGRCELCLERASFVL
jgi:hypothetical protein